MDISCVLIDDERMAIDHLLTYIEPIPSLRVVGTFTDPVKALAFLEETSVDVVFMDVEMPKHPLGSVDLVTILGNRHRYIFTTAYPQYALKSYDYDAVDLLHKPYSFERFAKAVQKVKAALTSPPTDAPAVSDTHSYVRYEGKLQRLELETVSYIQSERSYISIYTDNDGITLQMAIGDIEKQLPGSLFIRVHKSYIVSRKRLDQIETNHVGVLRGGKLIKIPIGDVYRKAVLDTIMPTVLQKK